MRYFLIFIFISASVVSQDFSKVKLKTDTYRGLLTAEQLANNIERDFSITEDKVKALFCWMTKNIRYDLEEFYNPNRKKNYNFSYRTQEELEQKMQQMKDKTVARTLSSRKAVCEGYAQTFSKVCNLLAIENEVVQGYVRQNVNSINKPQVQPNHAWNAVKLNNEWIFIDVTWASGHEINGRWLRKFKPYYYNIKKQNHFKTHLPEDTLWMLRIGRIEKENFYNQPIYNDRFLTSKVELVAPRTGTLLKREGKIEIKLKNLEPTKQIHIWFPRERFAQKPNLIIENDGITKVSIIPADGAKRAYLMLDKEVVLEFLVE